MFVRPETPLVVAPIDYADLGDVVSSMCFSVGDHRSKRRGEVNIALIAVKFVLVFAMTWWFGAAFLRFPEMRDIFDDGGVDDLLLYQFFLLFEPTIF